MPKLFVCSDIHSFLTPTLKALNEAGFDSNNENHWLIICGDAFDRGPDTAKMLDWMLSLDRLIYIKGNHDILMQEMLDRGFPLWHDAHNGTEKSYYHLLEAIGNPVEDSKQLCKMVRDTLQPLYDKMVNYFETKHFVFCHGFLPSTKQVDGSYKLNPQWRRASKENWNKATWLNGINMAYDGLYVKNKTIVVGHFHTSWGHAIQDKSFDEWGENADFSPFYYEDKLIAIDRCTAYTGEVNVLVLEDEFLED